MSALARFQISGYLRSARVLPPLVVIFLIMMLVLLQAPGGPDAADLATGTLGDVPAFMFPVWAWAARALLDTQPDEQRTLSASAARRPAVPTWAGLLAAYAVNVCLGALVLTGPLLQAAGAGVDGTAILAGTALSLLVAAAGTLLGAWTTRAVIPGAGPSLLALLAGATAALLLGLGPLAWLSVPMVDWLRAAHHGSTAFVSEFPRIALHLTLWSMAAATGYHLIRRHRP